MIVVAITGSREWFDRAAIEAALAGAEMLIVGDCPTGADELALELAFEWDIWPMVMCASKKRAALLAMSWKAMNRRGTIYTCADWEVHGKHAGPMRNRELATRAALEKQLGMDVRCHAFPLAKSVGTRDCISQLRAVGLQVDVHEG